jgi:hypothetical protein
VLLPALNSPFPTLAHVASVFRDLGREHDFVASVLDVTPVPSPWIEAARAIVAGDLARAADVVEQMGDRATAEYVRLRDADSFEPAVRRRKDA